MSKVRLALLWHQHQPFYKDLRSGTYLMPWVRLHGTKDYWGMARILSDFGGAVKATVNLVPGLLAQIEDYVAGTARDEHYELSKKPARDLTRVEREEALDVFFRANRERMILPSPRYSELLAKRRPGRLAAAHLADEFTIEEFRDLQVWGNLAWFHRILLKEDDLLRALVAKDRKFTEAEKGLLLEKQREVLAEVVPMHRRLVEEGVIEVTTSPYYHPILPLLVDMESAWEGLPLTPLPSRRTSLKDDAVEHLRRAVSNHERIFGARPRGLWPSEGSVSPGMLPLVAEAGLEWLATDEEVLLSSDREARGDGRDLLEPWRLSTPSGDLSIVFRDHRLSDLIGFDYQRMHHAAAAADFLSRIRATASPGRGRIPLVTVILDGENPWEHYPDGGVPFLRSLYERLARDDVVETVLLSEHLAANPPDRKIRRLRSGSWIHANFAIWIGHEEDVRAWDYLFRVREDLLAAPTDGVSEANLELARESLLIAEGSDWYWWYGDDHTSGQDDKFDSLFRAHLRNVYGFLGRKPPRFLDRPVSRVLGPDAGAEPVAFLRILLDGRVSSFFEWFGAGQYRAARGESLAAEGGAMHRGGDGILAGIAYGFDAESFFLRVDLDPEWRDILDRRQAVARELCVRFIDPRPLEMTVPDLGARPALLLAADGRTVDGGGVEVDAIVEIAVPFQALGLEPGEEAAFLVELGHGELLAERLPGAETVRFVVPTEDFDAERWRV